MMVILDPGHGKNTPGKRSPVWSDGAQLLEWEFSRDIVRRIQSSLNRIGIDSKILVPEALDISLKTRVNRANVIAMLHPGSFLISVHGNAAEHPNTGTGWEVWTSPGETTSDEIATHLFKEAQDKLQGFVMRSDYCDKDCDKESKFYMLVHTKCPAVLTENLFYDNEKDCRFMMSEEGRYQIALLHVEAILNYIIL